MSGDAPTPDERRAQIEQAGAVIARIDAQFALPLAPPPENPHVIVCHTAESFAAAPDAPAPRVGHETLERLSRRIALRMIRAREDRERAEAGLPPLPRFCPHCGQSLEV